MTDRFEQRSPEATKRLARLAGVTYVALGLLTAFGFYHAPLVQGDLSAIGRMLIKSELRFRIGVVADVLAAALSVPLALFLYELFRPVHRVQAALMALLLLVAAPISFVVALNYVAAQWLLSGAAMAAAIPDAYRETLGMLFLGLHRHGVLAVELFWGLWLLPFGLLVIRSRYLPRVLGFLLIIGAGAYVAHSITSLLLPGQAYRPLRADHHAGTRGCRVSDHALARGQGGRRPQGELGNGRTNRCSEREPANSPGDKVNVIAGWLPSLTFALGHKQHEDSRQDNL